MNWEAIGALAEVFGAVGVITTLLYLSFQVRQSVKDTRASAIQQLGRDYADHSAVVMSDENVSAFVKGLTSYSSLLPEERLKFDACATGYVNLVEHTLYHTEAGRLTEVVEMLQNYLGPRLLAYPGFEEWWHQGEKSGFGRPTQGWIDEQLERQRGGKRFWHTPGGAGTTE
jgi:hypothetical protein